jgi:hypothetical protein
MAVPDLPLRRVLQSNSGSYSFEGLSRCDALSPSEAQPTCYCRRDRSGRWKWPPSCREVPAQTLQREWIASAEPILRARQRGHTDVVEVLLKHRYCRDAYEEARRLQSIPTGVSAATTHIIPPAEEAVLRSKVLALVRQKEIQIRAEEEAKIKSEEGARIRAEEEVKIRDEKARIRAEEEEKFREKIRAEIRAEVIDKLRVEIRAQLLAKLSETCPICHAILADPVTTTTCGHKFCKDCLEAWRHRRASCPMCRSIIR